ncbi:MAG: response regulator [Deltaproteobacteria bacterium]
MIRAPIARALRSVSARLLQITWGMTQRRILIAEDDRALRTLLARHLRRGGFEVIEARDGTTALTRLGDALCEENASYDLLISDVQMPGHTGLDLASELKRGSWSTPILLITAFGSEEVHAEAERLGATMLDKPLDLDALTTTVERLLS